VSLLTDELRALIGQERVYTAPEELGRASIRYFARAAGLTDPAYYRGDLAPPTLICETNQYVDQPRDEDGYPGHGWHLEVPGTRLVRGGNSYEFGQPVRPDDIVTATWRVVDLTERSTGAGVAMLVLTSRARYTNQRGEWLATNDETLIYLAEGGADRG
jgi:hypothetical protein